jgi:hypothetical protein
MGEDGHTASLFPGAAALADGLDMARSLPLLAVQPLTAPHLRFSMSKAALLACDSLILSIQGRANARCSIRLRKASTTACPSAISCCRRSAPSMSTGLLIPGRAGRHRRHQCPLRPETAPGVLEDILVLPCASHPTLEAAMRSYLAEVGTRAVAHAAIGIANPVTGDWVQMTNHHWAFSIEATRQALELTSLIVINDFTALALSLPHLPRKELVQVGAAKQSLAARWR